MTRRPIYVEMTPGLPPDGAKGQFIGKDADGGLWLLRWNACAPCWEAIGWHLNRPKGAWPELCQLHAHSEHDGLITGWVQGPDAELRPGRPALDAAFFTGSAAP